MLHTGSYIIYAVTTSPWLILVSKLFSGVFIGMEMTLAFAYFGESYEDYKAALKELGKKEGRVKDRLFALHSIGVNVGYLFGPGTNLKSLQPKCGCHLNGIYGEFMFKIMCA